jgi:hypothetical protein
VDLLRDRSSIPGFHHDEVRQRPVDLVIERLS